MKISKRYVNTRIYYFEISERRKTDLASAKQMKTLVQAIRHILDSHGRVFHLVVMSEVFSCETFLQ
jgi:hypothetical protein